MKGTRADYATFHRSFDDFMAGGISSGSRPEPAAAGPSHGTQAGYAHSSSPRYSVDHDYPYEADQGHPYASAGESSDVVGPSYAPTHQHASSSSREYAQPKPEPHWHESSRAHTSDAHQPSDARYDDAPPWESAPSNSPRLPSPEPHNLRVAATPAPGQLHPWAQPNSIPAPKSERPTPGGRRAQSLASHKLRKSSSAAPGKGRKNGAAKTEAGEAVVKIEPFEPRLLPEPPERPPVWPELHVLVKLRRQTIGEVEMRDVKVPAPRWEAVGTAAKREDRTLGTHVAQQSRGAVAPESSEQQGSAPTKYSHAALLRAQGRALARDDRKLDVRALWIARVKAEQQRKSGEMPPVPWEKGNVVLLRNVRRGSKGLN